MYIVPAFTGLGSPYWDPYARGTIVGLTRGTGRAHLARAVVEAMTYQTRDVVEAMERASGRERVALRADGGAAVMDLLLQLQADQLQVPVARPTIAETTALGAAYLAGLAAGVWSSLDEIASLWQLDREFTPRGDRGRGRPALRGLEASRRPRPPDPLGRRASQRRSAMRASAASSCRSRARNGRPLRPSTSSWPASGERRPRDVVRARVAGSHRGGDLAALDERDEPRRLGR